jgi:hypothetical protein
MYSQSGFHQELAHDRQRQLTRGSDVHDRSAPHVAEMAAGRRAELAAERRRALRYEPARAASVFAVIVRRMRGTPHVRPRGV